MNNFIPQSPKSTDRGNTRGHNCWAPTKRRKNLRLPAEIASVSRKLVFKALGNNTVEISVPFKLGNRTHTAPPKGITKPNKTHQIKTNIQLRLVRTINPREDAFKPKKWSWTFGRMMNKQ